MNKTFFVKKSGLIFIIIITNLNICFAQQKNATAIPLIKNVDFYDGYHKNIDVPVPQGLIKLDNTTYLKKLTHKERALVGDSLWVKEIVKAGCDNYDRIGRIELIAVPKGKNFDDEMAQKFELLRIMTPFNYKTRQPDNVPYSANISVFTGLIKNQSLDIWVLVDIFGSTGVGQKETFGCGGSFLTYSASVSFITEKSYQKNSRSLYPLLCYYSLNGKDTADGHNAKSQSFTLQHDVKSATLYLISSGHGAGKGGEEYNWRQHVIYLDGKPIMKLDVNQNCVPYEIYNTRINGIYSSGHIAEERRTWCPGAPVPIRTIELGALKAGTHSIKLVIPDANLLSTESTYYISEYVVVE